MSENRSKTTTRIFSLFVFLAIFLAAGWMRLFGLDWDQDTHLHPDERYLTMVASALEFPGTPEGYWDTWTSPLNPENRGYKGYVYGTLPLFAARAVGSWIDQACVPEPHPLASAARLLLLQAQGPCIEGTYTGYGGIHLVGRLLSALADLLTLIGLTLLARLLFKEKVALLSAALYAFAVLPIQHAHFFVVDSFGTVFVVWTLYFSALASHKGSRWPLLLAGVTTGLAVASKISTWPVAALVGVAGVLIHDEDESGTHYRLAISSSTAAYLVAAGTLAFLAFRTAQPYAFSGPGFLDFGLNASWMDSMRYIRELVKGEIDTPPNHQWTNRAAILFPLKNMIFWGLGLPLGIAAWIGWAGMGWQMIRRRDLRPLLPWIWGTLFFLYQGTQWVKSMRYLLPIYPVFVLFAAWILVQRDRHAANRPQTLWGKVTKGLLRAAPWGVLIGTALWAAAFLQLYARPYTRIAASQWIFDHVPPAVTIQTQEGLDLPVPMQPQTLSVEGASIVTAVSTDSEATLTQITLNKVKGGQAGPVSLRVFLISALESAEVLSEGHLEALIEDNRPVALTIPLDTPLTLSVGQEVYLRIDLVEGTPITVETSVIANEHWDDPLPVRFQGKDPFWNWYRGLVSSSSTQMNLYDNDTIEKREQLLAWLDETDYIVLSSNRLYGSIPRLPLRYPLTMAYYQALFDGRLGFDLAAEFVSFPSLGPCQFDDQEAPFAIPSARYTNSLLCTIPYPAAEEAFSVYDHPRVLIFSKTAAYSRSRAETLLPASLAESAQWMTPLQATQGPGDGTLPLVLKTTARLVQEAGGTWSRLFDRDSLQNRFPFLSVLTWWSLGTLLGWIAFPWLCLAFPSLRDRGYGLARAAGLLMWAYPAWLLSSLHLIPHTRLLLWLCLAGWGAASVWLVRSRLPLFTRIVKEHGRDFLRVEVIFAVLYLAWVVVRSLNPDLYHPVAGGEKPMDFAYLNAVIRSSWFPPYDPWFAGGFMNYYYFGFVLVGSLIKASGIIPSVAYNLAVPTLFAMTGVGGYTLASNLSGKESRRAHRAGIWGLLFTVLLGNLGELQLIVKGLAEVGNVSFPSLIPGYQLLVSAAVGVWKILTEDQVLSFRPEWWYWNATRIIPLGPGEYAGPINEFPLFTFLYADLHAHMMAFPLTQVALGIALQWGLRAVRTESIDGDNPADCPTSASRWHTLRSWLHRARGWLPRPLTTFFLAALVAGALRATNTWDYPTYLAVISLSYLLPLLRASLRGAPGEDPASAGTQAETEPTPTAVKRSFSYAQFLMPVALFILAELLFRPYTTHYAIAYDSFGFWSGQRTPLKEYFIMHGHLLVPLILMGIAQMVSMLKRIGRTLLAPLLVVLLGTTLLTLTFVVIDAPIAWVAVPFGTICALLILDQQQSPRAQLLWFWTGTAVAIMLAVEVIVIEGDIGRMNTVFKFYLQVWMLLAVCAAVALEALLNMLLSDHPKEEITASESWLSFWLPIGDGVATLLFALLFAASLYPLFAIPAKIRDRWNPDAPTGLDGMAYMSYVTQYENDAAIPLAVDAEVIRWMQEHVEGSPPIMEMNAAVEYVTWGNRVSIYTGLPGVIGWRWHQVQQRLVMPAGTAEARQQDVRDFYNTMDPAVAREILSRYYIRYVILTPYERACMDAAGLPKFAEMVEKGWLETVYDVNGALIYRVK